MSSLTLYFLTILPLTFMITLISTFNHNLPSNKDHILFNYLNQSRLESSDNKFFNHLIKLIFLQVPNSETQIIISNKHLIALKDMLQPKLLLDDGKSFEYFDHKSSFYLYNFSHSVGSNF